MKFEDQLADIFTRTLCRSQQKSISSKWGLYNIHALASGGVLESYWEIILFVHLCYMSGTFLEEWNIWVMRCPRWSAPISCYHQNIPHLILTTPFLCNIIIMYSFSLNLYQFIFLISIFSRTANYFSHIKKSWTHGCWYSGKNINHSTMTTREQKTKSKLRHRTCGLVFATWSKKGWGNGRGQGGYWV